MKFRIFSCILVLSLLLSGCAKAPTGEPDTNPEVSAEQTAYDHAMNLLKSGDYEQARITLLSIKDYKDAADHLADLTYLPVGEVRKDFGYEGSQDQIQTVTYTYNEDGVLVKSEGKYADGGGPEFSVSYEYKDGRLSKTESFSEAGDSTITYEYDAQGRRIRQVGATRGANVGGITAFTYDDEGRCETVSTQSYFGSDPAQYGKEEPYHTGRSIYEYGADGTVGKVYEMMGDDITYTYTASYNEQKQPTQIICLNDGQTDTTEFTYNEQGQCTEVKTAYMTYRYTYDANGSPATGTMEQNGEKTAEITYTYKLFYKPAESDRIPHPLEAHLSVLDPFYQ